jgi:hypothetical protein
MIRALATLGFALAARAYPAGDAKFQATEVGNSHREFDCPSRSHAFWGDLDRGNG